MFPVMYIIFSLFSSLLYLVFLFLFLLRFLLSTLRKEIIFLDFEKVIFFHLKSFNLYFIIQEIFQKQDLKSSISQYISKMTFIFSLLQVFFLNMNWHIFLKNFKLFKLFYVERHPCQITTIYYALKCIHNLCCVFSINKDKLYNPLCCYYIL